MEIPQQNEKEVSIDSETLFEETEVAPGDKHNPAYTFEVPDGQFVVIEEGTPIAPEIRDVNGDPVDDSTRIQVIKADRRGQKTRAKLFDGRLGQFDFAKMRTDEDFAKVTNSGAAIDEYEELHVYVTVPSGSNGMDAANSRMTVGNPHTREGHPVYLRDKSDLSDAQEAALKQISSNDSGNN